jgi:hypothetical protein
MGILLSYHPLLNLHLNQVEAFSQAHASHHLHQLQIATTPLNNIWFILHSKFIICNGDH